MKSMTLKQARLWRGYTQVQLAELSGVAQNTISKLEISPDPNPTAKTIDALAVALRMPAHRLIFLSTPENEPVQS